MTRDETLMNAALGMTLLGDELREIHSLGWIKYCSLGSPSMLDYRPGTYRLTEAGNEALRSVTR